MISDPEYLLAICSCGPGQQTRAREALDAILATAAFGVPVRVLFCGEGVLQLVCQQDDYTGSDKPLDRSLSALPLYDVHNIYADRQSLADKGLSAADILPLVEIVDGDFASALLGESHGLMSF